MVLLEENLAWPGASLPPFTGVKITKHFFTTLPKEKNQKVFPPVKQMCLAGPRYSNLSQRSQDKDNLGAPDIATEPIPCSVLINIHKCLGADRLAGQKHYEETFSVVHTFHLEEVADRKPAAKGNIRALMKSCHSSTAFPKAADYTKLFFFIGSDGVVTVKPSPLWPAEFLLHFKKCNSSLWWQDLVIQLRNPWQENPHVGISFKHKSLAPTERKLQTDLWAAGIVSFLTMLR